MNMNQILTMMTEAQTKVFAATAACDKGGTMGYLPRELKEVTGLSTKKVEVAVQELLEAGVLELDGREAVLQGVRLGKTGFEALTELAVLADRSNQAVA